ncbi:hypothetical protein [Actinotalea sp. C106]|uniref:hypothetical protein n=1 Tax=Actinotalea sp. C106 TaxID=2908644 RepID=UPI002027C9BD|nr:hypothetical protein [Actinotalea sp. C106]
MSDQDGTPAKRGFWGRLGRGLTVFLVVDVLLVLTFVVLAVVALGDRSPEDPAASPADDQGQVSDETSPEPSAPEEVDEAEEIRSFQMPSGNIFCELDETSARCTILSFTYEPVDPPEGCDGSAGAVLEIAAGGQTAFPCVEGEPSLPGDLAVLDYGEASTVGEMACQSSLNGVTCRHAESGAGFSLARAGYTLFP